jgi:hypothetical protein
MKPHKLAEYFPLLEGEEFEQLKQDIKENGLLEPIVTHEGQILDGVNRYNACVELGVLPDTREFNGGDPLSYVISANIRRRHMDKSQRAMLATEMLPELEAKARERQATSLLGGRRITSGSEYPKRARDEAAREFGISGESVRKAKRVKEQAPEKVQDIVKGKTTIYAVDTELRKDKAHKRAQARAKETDKKERQEKPREVGEYLFAIRQFEDAIKVALKVADYGKFSPEAAKYTINRHNKIRNILLGFDEILEGIE